MTTYIGFNTINQNKKFTLVDFDLIQRDLLNAFNIRQGELPGRPAYGSAIFNYLFENQVEQLQQQIRDEVQRVVGGDPRLFLNDVQVYPQENGILIQLQVTVVNTTDAKILSVFFDEQQRSASYVT
jgi:phage baseplate assembly protein W